MKMHAIYEDLLGNRTKVRILRIMFEYPDKVFSEHELSRFTHVPQPTIHRNIGDLVNSNLVLFSRMGKMNLLKLNKESVLHDSINRLFRVERDLILALEKMITEVFEDEDEVIAVNLYGSIVKGTERSDSDVDVLIVVDDRADIAGINEKIEELGREIRVRFGNHLSCIVKRRKQLAEIKPKQIYEEVKKGRPLIARKNMKW